MAFNEKYLGKVSSSGNGFAPNEWSYNGSTADGADDTAAEIAASGYFNGAQVSLTTATGRLKIGDIIHARGSDANAMRTVTGTTTNVTTESYAAIGTVDTAQLAAEAVTTAKIEDLAVTTAKLAAEAVTSAKLEDTQVKHVRVIPSLAEFIAGNTTPMELVAAPGAGKKVVLHRAQLSVDYGGTVLAAGGTLQVCYGAADVAATVASNTLAAATIIAAVADTTFGFAPVNTTLVDATSVNVALNLSVDTADFTGGTGSAYIVDLWYSIVDLA